MGRALVPAMCGGTTGRVLVLQNANLDRFQRKCLMAVEVGMSPRGPVARGALAVAESAPTAVAFHYTQTESFVALLAELGASLVISTYQANKLLVVRAQGPGLSTLVRTFDQPMGLAVDANRLTVGTRKEVWFMRNAPDIAPRIEPPGQHDACYLPRSCHVTGDIRVHELAWGGSSDQGGMGSGSERNGGG